MVKKWLFKNLKRGTRRAFSLYKCLSETQFWPIERLEQLQVERLNDILKTFNREDEIRDIDDLKRLPLTTKEELRGWKTKKQKFEVHDTSGSAGEPFSFKDNVDRQIFEYAISLRGWEWAGWRLGDRFLLFTHDARDSVLSRFYWGLGGFINKDYRIKPNKTPRIYKSIKPKVVRHRPSYLALICRELSMPQSGVIALSNSEYLKPYRKFIEKFFEVYDEYGLTESPKVAFECEEHSLHVNMELCILESVKGELVVTNLWNDVTPFIRYRTGDLGRISREHCPCGRELPIIKNLWGKTVELYESPTGVTVGYWAWAKIDEFYDFVKKWRVIIEDDEATLLLLRFEWGKKSEIRLRNYCTWFERKTGLRMRVEYTEDIPTEPSGKHKLIEIKK